MATVDKNFKVKHGLIVEGTTATVNGEDVITTGSTTDDLNEGSSNLYYTTARAKGDAADLLVNATLTNITITGNEDGLTITAENGVADSDTDDLTEGTTNLYFTNQRALDATASAYDAAGSADSVAGDLSDHTTNNSAHGVLGDVVGTTDSQTLTNKAFTGAVGLGIDGSAIEDTNGDLEVYAAQDLNLVSNGGNIVLNADGSVYKGSSDPSNELTTLGVVNTFIGDGTVDGSTGNTITDRIATAVSDLVDGAPELLNTLNELAAAINDDESFSSTIATQIGGKQNTLTAGTNIDITADTISVTGLSSTDISDFNTAALSATASAYDAAGAASTAEQNAIDYADETFVTLASLPGQLDDYVPTSEKGQALGVATLDASGYVPEAQLGNVPAAFVTSVGSNLSVTDGVLDLGQYVTLQGTDLSALSVTTGYGTTGDFHGISKATAAKSNITAGTPVGFAFDGHTAKLLISAKSGANVHTSEVLVAIDSFNENAYITEYASIATGSDLFSVDSVAFGESTQLMISSLSGQISVQVIVTAIFSE